MSKRKFATATFQMESDSDDDLVTTSDILAASFTCSSSRRPNGVSSSMPTTAGAGGASVSRASFRPFPGRFSGGMVITPIAPTRPSSKSVSSKPVTSAVKLDKKKRPKLVGPQTTVTINVSIEAGCEVESFFVHKNFITHYSPYFDAAFNGNFAEGQSQKLDLEDTEPHVFGTFVNWLYSQNIENAEGEIPDDSTLVNLWLLADKCLVPKLQNQVIRNLDRRAKEKAVKDMVAHGTEISEATNFDATITEPGVGSAAAATRTRTYRDIVAAAGGSVSQEIINATYARMAGQEASRQAKLLEHQSRYHFSSPFESHSKAPSYGKPAEACVARDPVPAPAAPKVKQNPLLFHRIYDNTTRDSKLREYFVDVCSKANVRDIEEDEADDYPHDMLVDIVNRMRRHDANKSKPISEYYVSEDIPTRG